MCHSNNGKLQFSNIVISAGLAYGQVNRLNGNLVVGDNPKSQIPYTGNNIATDKLTGKVGKIGLYLGVSYKLNWAAHGVRPRW